MKISELIDKLRDMKTEKGDLEVLVSVDGEMMSAIDCRYDKVEEAGDYPKDWNMPKGFEYLEIYS